MLEAFLDLLADCPRATPVVATIVVLIMVTALIYGVETGSAYAASYYSTVQIQSTAPPSSSSRSIHP